MTWPPDRRRLLTWYVLRDSAVLWDAETREIRDLAGLPDPCETRLSADGHALVLGPALLAGDVWLLTLK